MQLNYSEFGEGRPVVILHGLFGSARNWQSHARTLAEDYHVVTVDLRNHGLSPHADAMNYEVMANDVVELVNQLELDKPVILGHSMGGKVAMTAVLTNPGVFSAMICADIAPINYDHDFNKLLDTMNSLPLPAIQSRAEAEEYMAQTISHPQVIPFVLQNLHRTGEGFDWRVNLTTITDNIANIAGFPTALNSKTSDIPALFIGGKDSNYIRGEYETNIHAYFPQAGIEMIEDAGHWLHADQPAAFLAIVKSFINRV